MNIRDSTDQPLAPSCTGFMHQHNISHSGLLTGFTPFFTWSKGCDSGVVDIVIFAPDDSPHLLCRCTGIFPLSHSAILRAHDQLKNGPESNQRPMDTTSDQTSSPDDSSRNMTSQKSRIRTYDSEGSALNYWMDRLQGLCA
ncbi:hypothetical protein Tsp_02261 [Trichinella spiralis]|uniref:hypothetical protein n=1 Tax=Trichinella spiralis TaxID=6334 RepID=UPI0001EFCA99|nr:hypothetical protein Tsp_02261 [Trichinella spiralis]